MDFNIKAILDLREKLVQKQLQPNTEEATKQWLIMPMLVALGYDPYSSDIIPEYTADLWTKAGEKVDYMLQVNNQQVAIIECKKLDTQFQDKQISQLYRYYSNLDVHIAILTNGNDYWFFTDSNKENLMDKQPYYKIRLSEATEDELERLCIYSKDMIVDTNIQKLVKYEKFQTECKELVSGLRYNNIPNWLIEEICKRSGDIGDISKSTLAEYLYEEITKVFDGYNKPKRSRKKKDTDREESQQDTKSKKAISNIKLNHEYVFNDYSDGDWQFHKLDYAIIFGSRYEEITGRKLLIQVIQYLLDNNIISIDKIEQSALFNGTHKICRGNGEDYKSGDVYYFDKYNIYINTKLGLDSIIKFIEKLFNLFDIPMNKVKLSFKS